MSRRMLSVCGSLLLAVAGAAVAQPPSPTEATIEDYLAENAEAICGRFPAIPESSCIALARAGARSAIGAEVDEDALRDTLESDLWNPALLNSALNRIAGGSVPFGLEFSALSSEETGETDLALGFDVDQDFFRSEFSSSEEWRKQTAFAFAASGTIVDDSASNPRDFVRASFSGWKSFTTNIPDQGEEFANRLTDLSLSAAGACAGENAAETQACRDAKVLPYGMLDETAKFLESFRRFKVAADFGYEADQELDVTQTTFGLSVFGQFENWGRSGGIGRINPAFRVALDKVNPDDQTPRALAGDSSSYYRMSGELSLWIPLGDYQGQGYVLTANYRTYRELSPSDIVENANLDTYTLRTLSLTSPLGLFISYSKGELPFDLQDDDVVALGWQTYF